MDPTENKQTNENESTPIPARGTTVPSRITIQPATDRPFEHPMQPIEQPSASDDNDTAVEPPASTSTDPAQAEPAKTEPVQAESLTSEPVQSAPTQDQPVEPATSAAPYQASVGAPSIAADAAEPYSKAETVAEPANEATISEPVAAESATETSDEAIPADIVTTMPADIENSSWQAIATPEPVVLPADVAQVPSLQSTVISPMTIVRPGEPAVPPIVTGTPAPFGPTTSSAGATPNLPIKKSNNPFKRLPKLAIAAIVVALVLLAGGAAFYFGFYTNSNLLYSQALSNSDVAYQKLVEYAKVQSAAKVTSTSVDGKYSVASSTVSVDSKINVKADTDNAEVKLSVGALGARVDLDVRALKAPSGTTPDVYVKANGITGLGALLTGSAQAGAQIDALDGKWVSVDHTFIDGLLAKNGAPSTLMISPPTNEQIYDEVAAIGQVNKEYLFSTDSTKAVTTVQQKYGIETIDGHKVYHYKVGFVKANVKKYVTAQKAALKTSKLQTWITANNYETQVDQAFTYLASSTDDIKATDSVDVWADLNSRTIYKTRASLDGNATTKYIEAGFNYKRGDKDFKYFLNGKVAAGTFTLKLNLDSVTNAATFGAAGTLSDTKFKADFTLKTSQDKVAIEKPIVSYSAPQVMALYQMLQQQSEPAANGQATAAPSGATNYGTRPSAPAPVGPGARLQ